MKKKHWLIAGKLPKQAKKSHKKRAWKYPSLEMATQLIAAIAMLDLKNSMN